jgi:hypothetical protein
MKFGGVTRGRWAVLGLLAMLAALLQPLCAAYAAAHEVDHEAVQCCAEADTGAVAASPPPIETAKVTTTSPPPAVPFPVGMPTAGAYSYRLAAWNDPPPLPPLPYHVRSARIQR